VRHDRAVDARPPRDRGARRGPWRALGVTVLALVAALIPVPATAHDVLLATDPADGAVLDAAPAQVVLTFSAEQAGVGAEVAVLGPDGASWSDGPAVVAGTTVTQLLRSGMPNGAYTVAWRSVAQDGHPVTGTFAFEVAAAEPPADPEPEVAPEPEATPEVTPTPTPEATPEATATPTARTDDRAGDGAAWPWIAGGAALVVLLAVGVVALWVLASGDLLAVDPVTGTVPGVWRVAGLVLAVHLLLVAVALAGSVSWHALVEAGVLWRAARSVLPAQAVAQSVVLLVAWVRAGVVGQAEWLRAVAVLAAVVAVLAAVPRSWLVPRPPRQTFEPPPGWVPPEES